MTVPNPLPRNRVASLAAAALLALAAQPVSADLFQDELVTPAEVPLLVTLPAGIGLQCLNVIVSRDGNDTVLDLPDILPIPVEVWGINMERLNSVAPATGPQRATKGRIRTAFENRDGAGSNGRGCRLKDSAEVIFQSDVLLNGAVTQNFTFSKNAELNANNPFFLPVKFHPIIPTLVTNNVQALNGSSCLGQGGATVTPDGITIEIKNLSSLFSALNGCLNLDLQAGLPVPLPPLDVPSADLLLKELDLSLVPRLTSEASLFGIVRNASNPSLFNLDVVNVQNLVNTVVNNLKGGGTTTVRDFVFDLKTKGVARRPFTIKVKVVPPPVIADLVPVVNGDLLDIAGDLTTGLLGSLTQKVGIASPETCTSNNVPVKTVSVLAALVAAILAGDADAALTALNAASSNVTLPPVVFGARNNGPDAIPAGTPFTTSFTGNGGGPLNSSLVTQGLQPQAQSTQEARGPKSIKLLNLDLTGAIAGVIDGLGITKGCLVMPGFTKDPDSALVKADPGTFRASGGQIVETNENNNSATLD